MGLHENYSATALRERAGFESLGEMALAVRGHALKHGHDPRLEHLAAATTYGSEGIGSDGGFAVPPTFREAILKTIFGEQSLLSRCMIETVDGNSFNMPIDETTPWATSGNIRATFESEASAAAQTKPALGERVLKLNKLRVFVPVSNEVLEDAPGLDFYLRSKVPDAITFKLNQKLLLGNGVGEPFGVMNSGALITITKESSQASATIMGINVVKMFSRLPNGSAATAAWVYNHEIGPQLFTLSILGRGATGADVATFGGLLPVVYDPDSEVGVGRLLGCACIPSQSLPVLGTTGDLVLVDWRHYLVVLKSGPNPKTELSIHLWFDQDISAFKFTLRLAGLPTWSAAASPLNGSTNLSPYICLQTR
jgi:HK97 family phage major capsid protein